MGKDVPRHGEVLPAVTASALLPDGGRRDQGPSHTGQVGQLAGGRAQLAEVADSGNESVAEPASRP